MSATLFTKKEIRPNKRVCLRLKSARLQAGITIDALSEKTKIRPEYLRALENCRFDEIPFEKVYKHKFTKRYLRALHVDPKPYVEQLKREELVHEEDDNVHPHKHYNAWKFNNMPLVLRVVTFGGIVLAVMLYLGTQVLATFAPPQLTILSPTDGEIVQFDSVVVRGLTDPEVIVTLNGQSIKNDERGSFAQTVRLSEGLNTLTITAQGKHKKQASETRHVIYSHKGR